MIRQFAFHGQLTHVRCFRFACDVVFGFNASCRLPKQITANCWGQKYKLKDWKHRKKFAAYFGVKPELDQEQITLLTKIEFGSWGWYIKSAAFQAFFIYHPCVSYFEGMGSPHRPWLVAIPGSRVFLETICHFDDRWRHHTNRVTESRSWFGCIISICIETMNQSTILPGHWRVSCMNTIA